MKGKMRNAALLGIVGLNIGGLVNRQRDREDNQDHSRNNPFVVKPEVYKPLFKRQLFCHLSGLSGLTVHKNQPNI